MKFILPVLLFSCVLVFGSAFAQDAPPPVLSTAAKLPADAVKPADMAQRMALATQFYRVRPLREQVDATLVSLGNALPENDRAKYLADMHRVFNYRQVEDSAVKSMAESFTTGELKVMIAYFASAEGKSAAAKMPAYQDKLTADMTGALDAALTEIKYPKK